MRDAQDEYGHSRLLLIILAVATGFLLVGALQNGTSGATEPAEARVLHPTAEADGTAAETPAPTTPPVRGGTACEQGGAAGHPCHNVDLLAHMTLDSFGATSASDLWGWSDPETGNDYAMLGVNNGTAFVDVTQGTRPVYLGKLPTHSNSNLWRDVKVYGHYAYIISEAASHGMQVFDLHQLREVDEPPVTFSETAHYDAFGSAHNLAINRASGYAYAMDAEGGRSCSGGLHMIDLSDPTAPAFAGCYRAEGMIHDAQCVIYEGPDEDYQGREICLNSSVNAFTIVDVTDKENPQQLASRGYRGLAYAHQGWLTEDQRYFLLNDEFDEINYGTNTRVYVWDASDLDRPTMTGMQSGPSKATSHNLYIRDGYVYAANYTKGMRILRVVDLAQAELESVAHFDTYIPHNQPGWHHGAWTACPCFDDPDKVVISSIGQGLFVVRPRLPDAEQAEASVQT